MIPPRSAPLFLAGLLLLLACAPSREAVAEMAALDSSAAQSVEERRVAASIQSQRDLLAKQENTLRQQEMELKNLAAEVDKKLNELRKTREEMHDLFERVNEEEQQRLRKLGAMYGKMEPDQAARILVGLEEELAVAILSGMKDKSAGRILASMDRERAASLTRGISQVVSN